MFTWNGLEKKHLLYHVDNARSLLINLRDRDLLNRDSANEFIESMQKIKSEKKETIIEFLNDIMPMLYSKLSMKLFTGKKKKKRKKR